MCFHELNKVLTPKLSHFWMSYKAFGWSCLRYAAIMSAWCMFNPFFPTSVKKILKVNVSTTGAKTLSQVEVFSKERFLYTNLALNLIGMMLIASFKAYINPKLIEHLSFGNCTGSPYVWFIQHSSNSLLQAPAQYAEYWDSSACQSLI